MDQELSWYEQITDGPEMAYSEDQFRDRSGATIAGLDIWLNNGGAMK